MRRSVARRRGLAGVSRGGRVRGPVPSPVCLGMRRAVGRAVGGTGSLRGGSAGGLGGRRGGSLGGRRGGSLAGRRGGGLGGRGAGRGDGRRAGHSLEGCADAAATTTILHRARVLKSNKSRAVRQIIVISSRVGAALEKHLKAARVDLERLVVGAADEIAMADILRPGDFRVGLASERRALQARELGEVAVEVGGGEGAEVAADCAFAFDDHEPFRLAFELVDLHGFEEVLRCVGEDRLGDVAEAAWEVADGHALAVDAPVVAGEEEVHVHVICDDRLINWAVWSACCASGVERLCSTPAEHVC